MIKNKFTKAKQKWFKERLMKAQIDYCFRVLSPRRNKYLPEYDRETVCNFYNSDFKTWTFSSNAKFEICAKYIAIKNFFWYLDDKFFAARKLSFKNPNVIVEYETIKSQRKKELQILKEEGLI